MNEPADTPGPEVTTHDRQTVALLHSGDAEGLRRLVTDFGPIVRARLRQQFGHVLDHAEVDDVMEQATIRAWRSAATFDPERGSLRGWFSVIARNCALRLLQQRGRRVVEYAGDLDGAVVCRDTGGQTDGARQRLLEDLEACMKELPRLQRAVLHADLEAGGVAPAQELATRFATTANSIYVSRLKGRRALKAALQGRGHFVPSPSAGFTSRILDAGADSA